MSLLFVVGALGVRALSSGGGALATLGGKLQRIGREHPQCGWLPEGDALVRLPPTTPWAVVHFVGGAGFGSAPALCYDKVLSELADRTGVAVVATPFSLGIDHWALSEQVSACFEAGRAACEEKYGLAPAAPTLRLGHSLGAKLLVLASLDQGPAKIGLIAFNNAGLTESAALAAELFASTAGDGATDEQEAGAADRGAATVQAVRDAFAVAKAFGAATGAPDFDVTPMPEELEAAVAEADRYARETALFSFDGDRLDSSDGLVRAMRPTVPRTVTRLVGTHTSPVAFRLTAADLDPTLAALLGSAADRGVTVGSPSAVEPLVDALAAWAWPGPRPASALASARSQA